MPKMPVAETQVHKDIRECYTIGVRGPRVNMVWILHLEQTLEWTGFFSGKETFGCLRTEQGRSSTHTWTFWEQNGKCTKLIKNPATKDRCMVSPSSQQETGR